MSDLQALTEEHEYLMRSLRSVRLEGDARKLFEDMMGILEAHFEEEEDTLMPLLAALQQLARGDLPKQTQRLVEAYHRLKEHHEKMLDEHSKIRKMASTIMGGHGSVGDDVATLLESLLHHAAIEEEVLYPSALLAGRVIEGSRTPSPSHSHS